MARKKAAAAPKGAGKAPTELASGRYPLENFRKVVTELVKLGSLAKITVPHSWAMGGLPILSPAALRVIDLKVGSDKELGMAFQLDLKRSRK